MSRAYADNGAPRVMGGLLVLVVLGLQLGWASGGAPARAGRGDPAAEIVGSRRLGDRGATVLRSLEASRGVASRGEGVPGEGDEVGVRAWSSVGRRLEPLLGDWVLALPPPVAG